LILALTDEPQTTKNWDVGAAAEELVGRMLDKQTSARVLHDRVAPGRTHANLDHVVVTPGGVVVVDTKRYKGRIDVSRRSLKIAGRDRTRLVEDVEEQAAGVQRLLGSRTSVRGCLCFVGGEFTLIAPSSCRDVRVTGTAGLRRYIARLARGDVVDVDDVGRWLAASLAPARAVSQPP